MNQYNLTDEDKYRIGMMFEMMQVHVLKYMLHLIEESEYGKTFEYNKTFNLPLPNELKETPMILQNIEGFDNQYINISFEIVDSDKLNIINYKDFIKDESILDYIIDLVNNGANMIWDYFLNEKINDEHINFYLRHIKLSLESDSLIFTTSIVSPTQQTITALRDVLQKIIDYRTKVDPNTGLIMYDILSEDKKDELETSLKQADPNVVLKIEEKLKKMKKLVAKCSIIDKSVLPNDIKQFLKN